MADEDNDNEDAYTAAFSTKAALPRTFKEALHRDDADQWH